MREPLLLPLAAIATGILISQSFEVSAREALVYLLIFAALSLVAHLRTSAVWLIRINVLLACIAAGILADVKTSTRPPAGTRRRFG